MNVKQKLDQFIVKHRGTNSNIYAWNRTQINKIAYAAYMLGRSARGDVSVMGAENGEDKKFPAHPLSNERADTINSALGKTPDALPLLQKIVNLFDGDFEDPGLEIYGLIGGTEMCRGGQMLNDLLAEARLLLAPDAREGQEK